MEPKDKKKGTLEFKAFERIQFLSHEGLLSFPFIFIKMYMNKLQQRTTLKKTSKRAAITGVNN